jgi:hypothetical protein
MKTPLLLALSSPSISLSVSFCYTLQYSFEGACMEVKNKRQNYRLR